MKKHIFRGREKKRKIKKFIYKKIRLQLIEIERKIVQKGMWHTHGRKENIMDEQYS